jgi:hypothetical protein
MPAACEPPFLAGNMDPKKQLAALADLAEALGIEVRRAPSGDPSSPSRGGGAVVRLRGKSIIFLEESAPVQERISVLAGALAGREELAGRFLPPQIRELLERAGEESDAG